MPKKKKTLKKYIYREKNGMERVWGTLFGTLGGGQGPNKTLFITEDFINIKVDKKGFLEDIFHFMMSS